MHLSCTATSKCLLAGNQARVTLTEAGCRLKLAEDILILTGLIGMREMVRIVQEVSLLYTLLRGCRSEAQLLLRREILTTAHLLFTSQ